MKGIDVVKILIAAAALTGCGAYRSADAAVVAIVGATVVHVEREGSAATSPDMTIVIHGERIESLAPAAEARVARGAQVIDAHGKWVIPGLIDSHVHFFQSGNLYTRPDAIDLNSVLPYAQEAARNKARLPATFKVWLASGVTGVVDVGGPLWNFEVRRLARRSDTAPRVAVAGPLVSMVSRAALDIGDPPIIEVRSPEEARALVERELRHKPDYVKVWFIHRPSDDLQAQTQIVKAAGDAAHGAGVPLAVHATELEVAKAALRAGADFLVHSVQDLPVDDEFLGLMKGSRALYCPTLFVSMGYDYALSDQWVASEPESRLADPQILKMMHGLAQVPKDKLSERAVKRLERKDSPKLSPVMAANLKKLWDAGITVVMGTDAGNIGTVHGPAVFREMALMEESGLSALQVLRSATLHGARALRMERETGTVDAGRLADLVILDADPLATTANLARAYRVIKGGTVFDPKQLIESLR